MRSFKRSQRVADQIKRDASEIISDLLRDRASFLVTVSDVEISDDLRNAKVFYTVLGKEKTEIAEVEDVMNRYRGIITKEIGHRLRIRKMPEITLHYDKSLVEGLRMTDLIDKVMSEDEERAED